MKLMNCEMCGSGDLIKQDGVFVCQYCGAKYSVEEARKMMIEGTVDVSGSTVKVDTSDELANLYQIARRARDDNNSEKAEKYYDMILVKDPNSWEASFYVVYFKAIECKIAEIQSVATLVTKSTETVLKLIRDNINDEDEQIEAYTEVAHRVGLIADLLFNGAHKHYFETDPNIRDKFKSEWLNNVIAAINCVYLFGDNLNSQFGEDREANNLSVTAWSQGVAWHQYLMRWLPDKEQNRRVVKDYVLKIKDYKRSYTPPKENGCYIATAVYGSYECPQVWTLRRYRDNTLAETWYGRAFIKTYYIISPTLVTWFGHTEWFKKIWKWRLDHMVTRLNSNGIEDTPYDDRPW